MYSIYIDNSISMYITVLIYTIHFTSVSCTWHIVTSHRICINEIWLIPLISLILRKRRTRVPAITVFAIASRSWKQMASQFLKMCLGFRNLWEKHSEIHSETSWNSQWNHVRLSYFWEGPEKTATDQQDQHRFRPWAATGRNWTGDQHSCRASIPFPRRISPDVAGFTGWHWIHNPRHVWMWSIWKATEFDKRTHTANMDRLDRDYTYQAIKDVYMYI